MNLLTFLIKLFITFNFVTLIKCGLYKNLKVSCKTEQQNHIDWFYVYKLPKNHVEHTKGYLFNGKEGYQYMFLTSDDHENWQLSNISIDNGNSMIGLTLQPLFDDTSGILLLAYNDEYPNGTIKASGAHAKGVLATDGVTGIWLIHSIPKFPEIGRYRYPISGATFGQTLLCFTFSASEIEKIGEQLLINAPQIYYFNRPEIFKGKFPSLENIFVKKWNRSKPYYDIRDIYSLGGVQFKTFAKSSKLDKELYEDIMAPALKSNLLVQSWRNGGGNIASNCTLNRKVYNVEDISNDQVHVEFKATQDHSKWAVSKPRGLKIFKWRIGGDDSLDSWICVGDINRQLGQLHRGGGQICQKHKKVSKLYRVLIKSYEKC